MNLNQKIILLKIKKYKAKLLHIQVQGLTH